MLLWEEPGTTHKPSNREKDWRTLRRVKDQLALIRLELAAQSFTSLAKVASRDGEDEQHRI